MQLYIANLHYRNSRDQSDFHAFMEVGTASMIELHTWSSVFVGEMVLQSLDAPECLTLCVHTANYFYLHAHYIHCQCFCKAGTFFTSLCLTAPPAVEISQCKAQLVYCIMRSVVVVVVAACNVKSEFCATFYPPSKLQASCTHIPDRNVAQIAEI